MIDFYYDFTRMKTQFQKYWLNTFNCILVVAPAQVTAHARSKRSGERGGLSAPSGNLRITIDSRSATFPQAKWNQAADSDKI